jgi:hypothetical protein
MADLLSDVGERVRALAGEWSTYSVVGSFLLYVVGYLALRFHLTVIGIGTDLAVLDERYLFTGARFLVYLVSSVPIILLIVLPLGWIAWRSRGVLPAATRARILAWGKEPTHLASAGIVFAVIMIQFVMRQCFLFSNLLLAPNLPAEPAWLVALLLDDQFMPLYFSALVAGCLISLAILAALRRPEAERPPAAATKLLAFLAAVQLLLLPVNYGVLILDKTLPRVVALGEESLSPGDEAWLVWEGKDGVTFLVRSRDGKRLVTLPNEKVTRTEILGFDRILPRLFGTHQGG